MDPFRVTVQKPSSENFSLELVEAYCSSNPPHRIIQFPRPEERDGSFSVIKICVFN